MLTGHRAAVLGSPIAHSLSPALHRAAYAALGLDCWSYSAVELTPDRLPGFLAQATPEWAGLSVTMPLKEAALAAAAEATALARRVGAVNTLVRRPDGGWFGDNTDVYGAAQALREAGVGDVGRAVVVGSGATGRSVLASLASLGCRQVTFVVRGGVRPETVDLARTLGMQVGVCAPAEAAGPVAAARVVVSTTPTGTDVPIELPEPAGWAAAGPPVLLDVVYAGWPTPMARAFLERGAPVVSGFEMLLHQAVEQVRLMTGLDAPVAAMRAAGLEAMDAPARR